MIKYALLAGIGAEWLTGPAAATAFDLARGGVRTLVYMALAWAALEAGRLLLAAVEDLFTA